MSLLNLSGRERRQLEGQLRAAHNTRLYQRTLAVLERDRGRSVSDISRMLHVDRRTVQRWLNTYLESHDAGSLRDEPRSGRPRTWSDECSQWLEAFVQRSPVELGYFAANWTIPLLRDALALGIGRMYSDDSIRNALSDLGYVWKRPRYVLEPDPDREKKTANLPRNWAFATSECLAG